MAVWAHGWGFILYRDTVATLSWLKLFLVYATTYIRVSMSLPRRAEMDKLEKHVLWHTVRLLCPVQALQNSPVTTRPVQMSTAARHRVSAAQQATVSKSQWFQEGCQGSIGLGIFPLSSNSRLLFSFKLNKNYSTWIWIKTRGLIFVICTTSIGKLICAKHISFNLNHGTLTLWFQGNWELGRGSSLLALTRAVLQGTRNSFRGA